MPVLCRTYIFFTIRKAYFIFLTLQINHPPLVYIKYNATNKYLIFLFLLFLFFKIFFWNRGKKFPQPLFLEVFKYFLLKHLIFYAWSLGSLIIAKQMKMINNLMIIYDHQLLHSVTEQKNY